MSVCKFPFMSYFLDKLEQSEDSEMIYQDTELKDVQRAIERLEMKKKGILAIVKSHMRTRLEDNLLY